MINESPVSENGRNSSAAICPLSGSNNNLITPVSCKFTEDKPCEKYRQFMDSSKQERTFMIEKLVETFASVIDSIWQPKFLVESQKLKVMPTLGFCNEILKRSKATYSTVQISLFYIFRVKKIVHEKLYQRLQSNMQTSTPLEDLMCCGRRMFLASLMVASKYLHDKNYHNKAWSKITGLDIKEINAAEMAFLKLIDYKLHISKPTFDKWYTQLHAHIQKGYKQTESANNVNKNNINDNSNIEKSISIIDVSRTVTTVHQTHSYAPMSPPESISNDEKHCLPRADSGVSFDIPNITTGLKRKVLSDDSDLNKRICQ